MKKIIVILIFSTLLKTAHCEEVKQSYKDTDNSFRKIKIVSSLRNGTPIVPTFKDSNGVWQKSTVISQACSIDEFGHPRYCNNVTDDVLGKPLGIPTLDKMGNNIFPISTGPKLNGSFISSIKIGTDPQAADPVTGNTFRFGGNSAVYLGAYPQPNLTGSPMGYWSGFPVNLVVGGSPSGPYNAGCSLCIFTDPGFQNTTIAALAGEDYTAGKVASGFDVAALYAQAGTENARLALPVASYTANTVTLSTALTPAQLLHVKQGMFISTNSLVPGMSSTTTGDADLPVKDYYAGIVQSVSSDGKIITVYGWAALGSTASGGVPSTTSLETYYWKNQKAPYVYIGAPTKMFGRNTYITYDGSRTGDTGNPSTSSVRQFEGEELDFNTTNSGSTPDHSVSFHGWTLGGANTNPNILTAESYALKLADSLPNYLEISDGCGSNAIDSGGYHLPGACILGTALNSQSEAFEYNIFANGNNLHWGLWLNRETDNTTGWPTASVNLGLNVDGTLGNVGTSGSPMAYISWNHGGNTGGMDFIANNGTDMLSLAGSGLVTVGGLVSTSNSYMRGTQYFQTGTGSGAVTQAHIAPDDSGNLYLQSDNNGKVKINNNTIVSGSLSSATFILPIGTPPSASAPCTTGQIEMDNMYTYSCVAENRWRRVSNGSSW